MDTIVDYIKLLETIYMLHDFVGDAVYPRLGFRSLVSAGLDLRQSFAHSPNADSSVPRTAFNAPAVSNDL